MIKIVCIFIRMKIYRRNLIIYVSDLVGRYRRRREGNGKEEKSKEERRDWEGRKRGREGERKGREVGGDF